MANILTKFESLNGIEHGMAALMTVSVLLVGEWTQTMTLYFALQILDVAAGIIRGGKKKEISSSVLKKGAKTKFGSWIYIIIGHVIDTVFIAEVPFMMGGSIAKTLVLSYLVLMELTSLAEHGEAMGAPHIGFLTKYLAQTKEVIENKEIKGSDKEA